MESENTDTSSLGGDARAVRSTNQAMVLVTALVALMIGIPLWHVTVLIVVTSRTL